MMFQDVSCLPIKAVLAALCLMFILVHTHTKGAVARQVLLDASQFDDGAVDSIDNTYCVLCDLTQDEHMCDKCYYSALSSILSPQATSSSSSPLPSQTKRSYGRRRGSMRTFVCGCCLWSRSADRECCDACAAMKRNIK